MSTIIEWLFCGCRFILFQAGPIRWILVEGHSRQKRGHAVSGAISACNCAWAAAGRITGPSCPGPRLRRDLAARTRGRYRRCRLKSLRHGGNHIVRRQWPPDPPSTRTHALARPFTAFSSFVCTRGLMRICPSLVLGSLRRLKSTQCPLRGDTSAAAPSIRRATAPAVASVLPEDRALVSGSWGHQRPHGRRARTTLVTYCTSIHH